MPSLSIRVLLALSCMSVVAGGCTSKACTDEAIFGVVLTVVDAGTGKDICDAVVTATDGTYKETFDLSSSSPNGAAPATCAYHGAVERAGTYHIVIARSGTAGATVDVIVNRGDCHVIPESRTVTLAAQ